jgi:hypothetical protein
MGMAVPCSEQYRTAPDSVAFCHEYRTYREWPSRSTRVRREGNNAAGQHTACSPGFAGEALARAEISDDQSNELLGLSHKQRLDAGTAGAAGGLIRIWKQWARSSGPRTEGGNAHSAENARRHGGCGVGARSTRHECRGSHYHMGDTTEKLRRDPHASVRSDLW